jgi:hypothetical protein
MKGNPEFSSLLDLRFACHLWFFEVLLYSCSSRIEIISSGRKKPYRFIRANVGFKIYHSNKNKIKLRFVPLSEHFHSRSERQPHGNTAELKINTIPFSQDFNRILVSFLWEWLLNNSITTAFHNERLASDGK